MTRRRSIVDRNRVAANKARKERRPYTLSEAALAQRRAAQPAAVAAGTLAGKSTGPVTEAGKAAISRNGWKHGRYSAANLQRFGLGATSVAKLFGKPCTTTCPFHPDNPERQEAPCSLVLDGLTNAHGGSCLDRTVYLGAVDAIMAAMHDGDMDGMHGLLATEVAANLQVLNEIRASISEHGVMHAFYERNKNGDVICRPDTSEPMIFELKPNPLLGVLALMTDKLGINFGELLATPRSRKQTDADANKANALHDILGAIADRAARARALPHGDA